ncbi:MAG: hypothetical protein ACR2GY_05645 [Phycisphaerales bacterium]
MLLISVTAVLALAAPPATEGARLNDGSILFWADSDDEPGYAAEWLVHEGPKGAERVVRRRSTGASRLGPRVWGATNDIHYSATPFKHVGGPGWEIIPWRSDLADYLLVERSRRDGELDLEARARIQASQTGLRIKPVMDILEYQEDAGNLDWRLFFDLLYLEGNDVTAFAVWEGELYHWTYNIPEEEGWVEHARVETLIDGPFRVQRAADNMYLIDENGDIYSTPPDRHRRIGRILGWKNVLEDETLILLEDHARQKIGIFKVAAGVPVALLFEGDVDALPDFHVDVPTPELAEQLIEMARILSEDGGE